MQEAASAGHPWPPGYLANGLKYLVDQTSASPTSASDAAGATSSQPSSSTPPTLQQIADTFDVHNLTNQQEGALTGELISSGALSPHDGLHLFADTVLSNWFDAQHFRIENGRMVATTPTDTGQLIGAGGPPGGPTYDAVQQMQQALVSDQYFGDTQNADKDQTILKVLNELAQLRQAASAPS